MAFQNIVFPNLKLIHGFKKGVVYPTSVVSNGTAEYRINRMAYDKFTWGYPGRLISAASKLALYTFYKSVGGSLDSFKFQDPDFPNFTGQILENNAATTWLFNLPGSYGHPLFNYDGAMVIKKNGNSVAWTHSIVNGQPIITIAGSLPGDTVTVESGACYLAARFEGQISWVLEGLNLDNTPSIVNMGDVNLIEVFEHA